MGRSAARKKRKLQEETASASGAPLPNGQNSAAPPPTAEPSSDPPDKQADEAFYEPLHSLSDDSASLASLLREAAATVSAGPSRLSDPRRVLHLMRHCAPRMPPVQLADRLTAWCQFLAGLLRAPRQLWCRDAACRTAARLLAEEVRIEDAHRLLAAGGLSQIITPLIEAAEQATPASLHCLRVILLHFGRGCGAQRGHLTRFLLQLFDMEKPGVSWGASRCVALLPRTGPAGAGGAVYAATWAGQMRGLIRAAHAHLDRLLDGVVEVQTFDIPEAGEHELELPDLPESDADPIRLRYRLARRVSAVCRVAALMLGSASKQPVAVPVTALLELAQRCVAAGAAAASAAMELQAARRVMYDVRAAALRMLEALILCCGVSLLQRGTALNRLLLSALQPAAASRPSPASETAHRQALRTLRAWLLTAGAGCGLQDEAEKMVKMLSEDVRPPQPAKVTLQTNPAATNGVTPTPPKKKKRAAADWLESDTSFRHAAPLPSRPLRCQAALDVFSQFVTALGPVLKVSAHQATQQLCVRLLLELQQAASPPPPYDSAACRAGLYRLLRALVANPNPVWPAPLQFAVRLFAHGATDTDVTVSMLCQDGQALCSRVVQPTHPTLFFPAVLTAYSKPPSAADSTHPGNTTDTGAAVFDGGAAVPVPPGLPGGLTATSDVTGASDDVRGPAGSAGDVPSDVSECGSSDSARLGSRLGSVIAAAAAAAPSPGGNSRPATPPGQSAPTSNQASPTTPQNAPGSSGGRSPAEQKPAASWLVGRCAAADGGSFPTVNIASSESSASADGRHSVELAEMEEDQKSIVLGESEEGEEEDERPDGRHPPPDDEDEVEILETKRARRDTMDDQELEPDVADMLRDFVNEDPEVE